MEKQEKEGWGKSVVERLSQDLRKDIPDSQSFSARNVWFMRSFYETYKDYPFLKQLVSEIPWGQNIVVMQKVKAFPKREYYIRACIENAWSRSVLIHQIEAGLYERDARKNKQHNFRETLPENLAEQA